MPGGDPDPEAGPSTARARQQSPRDGGGASDAGARPGPSTGPGEGGNREGGPRGGGASTASYSELEDGVAVMVMDRAACLRCAHLLYRVAACNC